MLVVRKGNNLGVVGRIIVTKNALSLLQVRICIANAHRISQFSADYFIEV